MLSLMRKTRAQILFYLNTKIENLFHSLCCVFILQRNIFACLHTNKNSFAFVIIGVRSTQAKQQYEMNEANAQWTSERRGKKKLAYRLICPRSCFSFGTHWASLRRLGFAFCDFVYKQSVSWERASYIHITQIDQDRIIKQYISTWAIYYYCCYYYFNSIFFSMREADSLKC